MYEAFLAGRPSPLPALPVQYADFAVWQREWLRGEILEQQASRTGRGTWTVRLLAFPCLSTGRAPPGRATAAASTGSAFRRR